METPEQIAERLLPCNERCQRFQRRDIEVGGPSQHHRGDACIYRPDVAEAIRQARTPAPQTVEGSWLWALEQLKAGRRAQRNIWAATNWAYVERGNLRWWDDGLRSTVHLSLSDLEATDWQLAPEQPEQVKQ